MYKFVKLITILFVTMCMLNGCKKHESKEYEYVDLGLPSGLKWATCNVGAEKQEDYGYYFAWGETKQKDTYTEDNNITNGIQLGDFFGDAEYDAAAANWRENWRMPNKAEYDELVKECTWEWIKQGGVNGYKVIGPNGNCIFLPAAGYCDGSSLFNAGEEAHYWSSTPDNYQSADCAYYLDFDYGDYFLSDGKRYRGQSVRPVSGKGVQAPIVTTSKVTNISVYGAECGGNVNSDGGSSCTSRGVCWSTSSNPTIEDNYTQDGEGVGEFTSYIYGLMPNTIYYVRAYVTNSVGTSYGNEVSFTTKEKQQHGEHEYVDLGLPSGLKWATCNVGANLPEGYGDYFAWGEIVPKYPYESDNSVTYNVQMGDISGNPQYDAAAANWGGSWRMPTQEELQELYDECSWQWTVQNGVNGYKVMGTNGNNIFIPAAGCRIGLSLQGAGERGYYWTSTPYDGNSAGSACRLYFSSSSYNVGHNSRYGGLCVRPVSE